MKYKYEVNKASAIKSILVILLYGLLLIVGNKIQGENIKGYINGFLIGTWFWPVFGITKYVWEPPIKRIKDD